MKTVNYRRAVQNFNSINYDYELDAGKFIMREGENNFWALMECLSNMVEQCLRLLDVILNYFVGWNYNFN